MGEGRTSSSRVSVYDAAQVMGVTVDAIRKRISRGTIPHERDEDGRVWVLLDTDQDPTSKVQDTDQPQSDSAELISELRARISSLERIPPQLEAAPEARESPQTAQEEPERAEPRPVTVESQESAQRPWWRRVFRG
jgi:hypothetical protein